MWNLRKSNSATNSDSGVQEMGMGAEEMLVKGCKLAAIKLVSSGDLFYSIMTVVNHNILCT